MALEEFYGAIGGDLDDVRSRLLTDERVEKFVRAFACDPTFAALEEAYAAGDAESAFRAAHTLKGIGRDLGFTALQASARDLADALRADGEGRFGSLQAAEALHERTRTDHEAVMTAMPVLDR